LFIKECEVEKLPGNCLLVISKNEGTNPISIAEQALDSGIVKKVIISDGSNEETFKKLKMNETKKIEVINERKYTRTDQTGKGVGMINGGLAAIKQDFSKIGFIDGDIYNPNINKWCEFLFSPLGKNVDVVKTAFSRNPADGQITRHITKPLIAMFLPNAWEIDQPLGGELALKKQVLIDLFKTGITPPYGWGIDSFITMKSLIYGYSVGEVYLGQKMHCKKTLTNLQKMFMECFQEAVRMIRYFYSLPVRKKIKPIVMISSPFKKNFYFEETYMDIKKEVERSLDTFKLLKQLFLPHDDMFYEIREIDDFSSFFEKTKWINSNVWVELLYWLLKKYSPLDIDQYYLRWKIRSLAFCLHEINTCEQAEICTRFQAKTASNFMYRIGERTSIDDSSKKMYFYKEV
jgi:glucosyl-3-phosphoglycerate synthase